MLRIHFTAEDLTRVRIADAPDPLAETVLSLPLLQSGRPDGPATAALGGWRERTRCGLRPEMRLLLELAPAGLGEYVPEAFVHAATANLADSLDHTWSLPRLQWETDWLATQILRPGTPRWIHALHQGDRTWGELVRRRLHSYHALAIAPYWSQILATASAERVQRALTTVDAGVEGLLGTLHPDISWSPRVLSVPCDLDTDLELAGRGILLVPTFFCPRPLVLVDNADAGRPPVLRYPLARSLADCASVVAPGTPGSGEGLTALLGTTRARTLEAAQTPAGTTELARRTGTSPATASHHASVLRAAGLLTTRRDGPAVRHTLTPLGRALLGA
ncbi:winged helix-turn-helix domain-containing protein [Streptomyces sp. NBC_01565]|uniref:ArsR/SmtB family transcription factor n=1 Tax=unclassified Streptomyces TaxID=2593676 RepID=UPI00225B7DF1|nr:winged helix-turn-helix domain-containing protein [Streptomyces sp. NBC_01565]MCX4546343.1 winged helix-turn-helix domain-containing protein [Streptomyces sp. NBC_01565]